MKYKEIKPAIYNVQAWIEETNPARLYTTLTAMLQESKHTILEHVAHHFPIQGYTCLWLLGESHLAVHTFPDSGRSYVELSGCNEAMSQRFAQLFSKEWHTTEPLEVRRI